MTRTARRLRILKGALFVLWLVVVAGAIYLPATSHIPTRELPRLFLQLLKREGPTGPLLIIGAYFASLGVPFPTMSLALVSSSAYGTFWGTLLAVFGFNLCTWFGFWIGRVFGRHFVETHERGWLKKYDQLLCESGLVTVLFMRLLHFPSDVVSLGCGMSKMPFRQFAVGTFFGSLPVILTYAILGVAVQHHRAWPLFTVTFVLSALAGLALRYSKWGKKYLAPPECPTV